MVRKFGHMAFLQKDPHSIWICKGKNGPTILVRYHIGAYSHVENNVNNINDVLGVVLTSAHWVMVAHWWVDHCSSSCPINHNHIICFGAFLRAPH